MFKCLKYVIFGPDVNNNRDKSTLFCILKLFYQIKALLEEKKECVYRSTIAFSYLDLELWDL
jgi:hypothetical protein